MTYLVIAYPKISEENFKFIQDYREINDTKYFNVVKPHFTIVFPTLNFSEHDFVEEAIKQIRGIKQFDFKIKCATINQDYSKDFYHEFLVPDQGYSDFVKLHDKLYSGKFFDNLRFDIDYIPHIGIGNSKDVFICKKNVDNMNSKSLLIEGVISTLDIVKYENDLITTLETIELL
jgi:hypothetical protein